MRNYAINNFAPLDERVDKGSLVENFVFNAINNMAKDWKINYWRTTSKAEVDFILCLQDEVPIEVKFTEFKAPKISRSLRSFINSYKPEKCMVATKDFWGRMRVGRTKIMFVPACYF